VSLLQYCSLIGHISTALAQHGLNCRYCHQEKGLKSGFYLSFVGSGVCPSRTPELYPSHHCRNRWANSLVIDIFYLHPPYSSPIPLHHPRYLLSTYPALFPKLLEFYRNLEAPASSSQTESPTVLAYILQYLNTYKASFARPIDSRYDIVLLGGALGSLFS
jgi:hypothetical protein